MKRVNRNWIWSSYSTFSFPTFGFLILLIGLFYLAKNLGWISTSISIWPIILIIIGVSFILNRLKR